MAEPFKNLVNRETVAEAARHLSRAWPRFDRARFETLAGDVSAWNFCSPAPRFAPTARTTDLIATADRPANPVAIMCMASIAIATVFAAMLVGQSGHRWSRHTPPGRAAGEAQHPAP